MITVRINLSIVLVTVLILISSFEIQSGVHAIEQVILYSIFSVYFQYLQQLFNNNDNNLDFTSHLSISLYFVKCNER